MGFGIIFREVVATVYRADTAPFILYCVTRAVPISFSVQQPFLLRLEDVHPGVSFPDFEERVEAYVDDVVVVGEE